MSDKLPRHLRVSIYTIAALCSWAGGNQLARGQSATDAREMVAESAVAPGEGLADVPAAADMDLPDAPSPAFSTVETPGVESSSMDPFLEFSSGRPKASGFGVTPNSSERVPLYQCPYDKTGARECRVHWRPLLISSAALTAFLNVGNVYTGYWYRWETTHGKWMDRWFDSDLGWDWNHWTDGNPALDQYVGHPMMGSITNYVWIQNDPKGATVQIGEPGYWKSRFRALAFTTVFHFQWKFGPFGEAGVGHIGDHPTHTVDGKPRNDTGVVELVTTPVGGLLWTMAEDALDKAVVRKVEATPRRPVTLLLLSFLTPSRATANIFRWRPPWYRDGWEVKGRTFWSQPLGPDYAAEEPGYRPNGGAEPWDGGSSGVEAVRPGKVLPVWPRFGGVHEFGAWWGFSGFSGPVWGYAQDVKYMPVDVTYSYLWHGGDKWNFRYAPELTALAMLDEPQKGVKSRFDQRKRTYGSGLSPAGFRASFYPRSRVQPFLSTDGGFVYFVDRVLSPQGSQFMYTIDFGSGVQIFYKQRQAISFGYRYQHLSNANISLHNPGTDTNVFYVAMSRFRSKGYR